MKHQQQIICYYKLSRIDRLGKVIGTYMAEDNDDYDARATFY